jgi:hypothetical protein
VVSLEQRHDLSEAIKADPDLRRIQDFLDGGTVVGGNPLKNDIRKRLLLSISAKDRKTFTEIGDDLAKRKIGPDSDWCQDDFLVFLLLLGNQLFGNSVSWLQQVIDARRHTPNSLPQKINEVFAALYRQEFGVEGELAFLKVPFLHLTGDLKIGPGDAEKVLAGVSDIDLWNQFSPFLRLLTQKAHDLVLTSRAPQVAETSEELIEGFKKHASNLTLRQWWNLMWSLPGKLVLSVVGTMLGLGLIAVLFGLGRGLVEKEFTTKRERPDHVSIADISTAPSNLPAEVVILGTVLQSVPAASGNGSLNVAVTCEPFSAPTRAFVIEVSHPEKAIRRAVAFIQNTNAGERPYTVVPVQKEEGRYRLLLPELKAGSQLVVLLNVEIDTKEDVDAVKNRFVLRTLQ